MFKYFFFAAILMLSGQIIAATETTVNDPSMKCMQEIKDKPSLKIIKDKVGLTYNSDHTPEMLKNNAFPNQDEKKAIADWMFERDACKKKSAEWREQLKLPAQPDTLMKKLSVDLLLLVHDLYEGKITYGQFAKIRELLGKKFSADLERVKQRMKKEKASAEEGFRPLISVCKQFGDKKICENYDGMTYEDFDDTGNAILEALNKEDPDVSGPMGEFPFYEEIYLNKEEDRSVSNFGDAIIIRNGQKTTEIFNKDRSIADLRLSPDGKTVAYIHQKKPDDFNMHVKWSIGEETYGDIWLMNSDGSNRRLLLAAQSIKYPPPEIVGEENALKKRSFIGQPYFSPDGKTVYFNRYGISKIDIYKIDLATGKHEIVIKDFAIANVVDTEGNYKGALVMVKNKECCYLTDPNEKEKQLYLVTSDPSTRRSQVNLAPILTLRGMALSDQEKREVSKELYGACIKKFPNRPELSTIKNKIALDIGSTGAKNNRALFGNKDFPNEDEKKTILNWVTQRDACIRKTLTWEDKRGAPSEYDLLTKKSHADFIVLAADLYDGKMTYGDFAKARSALSKQQREEAEKLYASMNGGGTHSRNRNRVPTPVCKEFGKKTICTHY